MIVFESVSKSYQTPSSTVRVLNDISFEIPAAKIASVIGPSGSGKSTLLSLAAGLDVSDSGKVLLAEKNLGSLSESERTEFRLQNIGFIFQNFELISTLTALENVMVPAELLGNSECEDSARELLEQVGLLHRLTHTPLELSGGEKQRVAIARAFINQPKILLADEPTGNLDRETGENIIELLFNLNSEQSTTLLIATHDLELAGRCEQILRFNGQGVLSEGLD